jgi:hypothetical protein
MWESFPGNTEGIATAEGAGLNNTSHDENRFTA